MDQPRRPIGQSSTHNHLQPEAAAVTANSSASSGGWGSRLRRLVGKAFTPGRVEALRPRVQQLADELAAEFLPRGEVELVGEFAFPLPLMVIMELLGLPLEDRVQFRQWAQLTVPRGADQTEAMRGYAAIRAYFADLVERRTR